MSLEAFQYFELDEPGLVVPKNADSAFVVEQVGRSILDVYDGHEETGWIEMCHPVAPEFVPWSDMAGGIL